MHILALVHKKQLGGAFAKRFYLRAYADGEAPFFFQRDADSLNDLSVVCLKYILFKGVEAARGLRLQRRRGDRHGGL